MQFKPQPGVQAYELAWKQHPQSWQEADTKIIQVVRPNDLLTVEATDLLPGTTYCVRIAPMLGVSSESVGDPSPDVIVDTEQVDCTPGAKSCCIVQ